MLNRALLGAIATLSLVSCMKSGVVRPESPIPEDLAKFRVLYVEVTAKNPAHQRFVTGLSAAVTQRIGEKKWFKSVSVQRDSKEPGLRLRLQIVSHQAGDKAARTFNMGGEAKIVAQGQLLDNSNGKVLGRFQLEGSSLRESHTSVSVGSFGYDTRFEAMFDELDRRALDSAAEYLVKFLKDKV